MKMKKLQHGKYLLGFREISARLVFAIGFHHQKFHEYEKITANIPHL